MVDMAHIAGLVALDFIQTQFLWTLLQPLP